MSINKEEFKVKFDRFINKYNKAKANWVELKYGGHVTDITNAASEVKIYSNLLNKLNDQWRNEFGDHYTDPCFYRPISSNNFPMMGF